MKKIFILGFLLLTSASQAQKLGFFDKSKMKINMTHCGHSSVLKKEICIGLYFKEGMWQGLDGVGDTEGYIISVGDSSYQAGETDQNEKNYTNNDVIGTHLKTYNYIDGYSYDPSKEFKIKTTKILKKGDVFEAKISYAGKTIDSKVTFRRIK